MATTTVSPNNAKLKFRGSKSMAKSKNSTGALEAAPSPKPDKDWEAEDALRTMQRAEEHQRDPDMMKRVAKHATKQKDGLDAVMARLQKQGLVSDKQAAKITNRRTAARA